MKDIFDLKILIVDDEKELIKMLDGILRKEGFWRLTSASTCEEAKERFGAEKPDLVLLDVMLPDGDGFSLLKAFQMKREVPVLFLSAKDEDEDRLLGLGLGADDYITKPFLPKELILRIKAVLRRSYFPVKRQTEEKPIFRLGETQIDLNGGTVTTNKGQICLTAKEYALLEKLYENKGNIVTGDRLCQAVWGEDLYGYENTLMVHIRRLREKLEPVPSNPQFLITARGLGYKLMGVKDE
ncbi:MAG: response regulator transcription factor [Eubacteriales bacterium]